MASHLMLNGADSLLRTWLTSPLDKALDEAVAEAVMSVRHPGTGGVPLYAESLSSRAAASSGTQARSCALAFLHQEEYRI